MSNVVDILIWIVIGAGLPLYIYLITWVLVGGYLTFTTISFRNVPKEDRRKRLNTPLHAYFMHLIFWLGSPVWNRWTRDSIVWDWIIVRSGAGALLGAFGSISWILLT